MQVCGLFRVSQVNVGTPYCTILIVIDSAFSNPFCITESEMILALCFDP